MMQQHMMQQHMMQQQIKQQQMKEKEEINKENNIQDIEAIEDIEDIEDIVDKIIQPNNDELPPINKSVNLSEKKENDDNNSIISEQTSSTGGYSKYKLTKLTIDKLKDICINNGGTDEGTKQVLIDRILTGQYK